MTRVVTSLVPDAHLALPGDVLRVVVSGPFDLRALVLGSRFGGSDTVSREARDAPGIRLRSKRLTITPGALRRGAERVVVLVAPERDSRVVRSSPVPVLTFVGSDGRAFARFTPPPLPAAGLVLMAEVYRRDARWRLRAVGRTYGKGLSGRERDLGVSRAEPAATETAAIVAAIGDVVAATNAERTRRGLRPLITDPRLTRAAQRHSEDMVRRAYFAHRNPDGEQAWDRAMRDGYSYMKVAENIAAGQRTAADVVQGWMDSPEHRRNILDPLLMQIGVGRAEGGPYGIYWTQVFGTPS